MRNSFIVSHHFKKIKEKMYFYVEIDLKKKIVQKHERIKEKSLRSEKCLWILLHGFHPEVFRQTSVSNPQ